MFTFGLICYFCPDSQNNILTVQYKRISNEQAVTTKSGIENQKSVILKRFCLEKDYIGLKFIYSIFPKLDCCIQLLCTVKELMTQFIEYKFVNFATIKFIRITQSSILSPFSNAYGSSTRTKHLHSMQCNAQWRLKVFVMILSFCAF